MLYGVCNKKGDKKMKKQTMNQIIKLTVGKNEKGYQIIATLGNGKKEYPQEGKTHKRWEEAWEAVGFLYFHPSWGLQWFDDHCTINKK